MDYKQERAAYSNSTYADKRVTVLALLKGMLGKGEVFDRIFNYVVSNPTWATEEELDEVFEIVMESLEFWDAESLKDQMAKLCELQDRMKKMREEEERQKSQERPEDILSVF